MPPKVTDTRTAQNEALHKVEEKTAAGARRIVATFAEDFYDAVTLMCMLGVEKEGLSFKKVHEEYEKENAPKTANPLRRLRRSRPRRPQRRPLVRRRRRLPRRPLRRRRRRLLRRPPRRQLTNGVTQHGSEREKSGCRSSCRCGSAHDGYRMPGKAGSGDRRQAMADNRDL